MDWFLYGAFLLYYALYTTTSLIQTISFYLLSSSFAHIHTPMMDRNLELSIFFKDTLA